jgi:hypothetical protein
MEWIVFIGVLVIAGSITWWFVASQNAIYCRNCGTKLTEIVRSYGFDERTGQKRHKVVQVCPKREDLWFLTEGPNWCSTSNPIEEYEWPKSN